jgi:L-aspartate oxidase
MKILNADVLIIGTGVAGLYCALNLDKNLDVVMLSKKSPEECNTYLAQGGIAVRVNEYDYDAFFMDTMKAGMYLNNKESVKVLVNESRESILDLDRLGVPFNKNLEEFEYTKEGAHVKNRIVHCNDKSGKLVFETLYEHVKSLENIRIVENTTMFDIENRDGKCLGVYCLSEKETIYIGSKATVLASGGIGGIFKNSTNQSCLTGDAMAIAKNHGIKLDTPGYIQYHPTALYLEKREDKRRFLISESLRGEGALFFNSRGERFVKELLPRNTVTSAILEELEKTNSDCVYLDITHTGEEYLKRRFPKIYSECLKHGINIATDKIPVTPSQHYHMGGIGVDLHSRTSMDYLYAVGECSCTGVHGGNRLASNSLLEGLVFSKRAAEDINAVIGENNKIFEPLLRYSVNEGKNLVTNNRNKAIEIIGNMRKDLKNELVDSR